MLIRRPLSIRFIEGEGGEGEGTGGGEVQTDGQASVTTEQEAPGQQSQGNPAWEPLRSELDPITFSKIEPHLKKWEADAQKRIESSNSQFAPFKDSLTGRQPQFVNQAIAYADMLDKEPERVYQMLGDFLQQTGRMPTAQEAEDALEEDEGETPADPRVDQIMAYLQQAERVQAEAQAESDLNTALGSLKGSHPDLSEEDTQEIIGRAAFAAQRNPGQHIDFSKALEAGYQEFVGLKNRILSTPRPGDLAPQLPPISGGTPSGQGQQQKSWGSYSNDDIQNFIAGQLAQNRG